MMRTTAMIPINVTLQYLRDGVKDSRRIKLSMDSNVAEIVTSLIDDLNLPREVEDERINYYLVHQRQVLDEESRLYDAGVQEGDILQLAVIDPNATVGKALTGAVLNRLGGKAGNEPLPVQAALVSPSGEQFPLQHTRALIGRADPKLGYPTEALDADLTLLDPSKSVSRPHALIVFASGEFTIRDLYSHTGLLLNGERVSPSKAKVLHDGDMLMLGEVLIQFRCQR